MPFRSQIIVGQRCSLISRHSTRHQLCEKFSSCIYSAPL